MPASLPFLLCLFIRVHFSFRARTCFISYVVVFLHLFLYVNLYRELDRVALFVQTHRLVYTTTHCRTAADIGEGV